MDKPEVWFLAAVIAQAPHWPWGWAMGASGICLLMYFGCLRMEVRKQ